jgi:hypothetical protein
MDSVPTTQQLDQDLADIAHEVAFELGRPWRVEELRAEALEAYPTAKRRTETSGLPPKQTDKLIRSLIYKQVRKAGDGMNALPFGEEKPTPLQIETALEGFSAERWSTLLESVDRVEVETLLSFIQQDADRLKQKLGAKEVGRIKERASLREIVLWDENNRSTLEPISDPYWVHVLREDARQENLEGRGYPAKGVSVFEETSERNLARLLSKRFDEQIGRDMKVSAYEVKQWLSRARQQSFEQYVADVGADAEEKRAVAFIDYWTMIRKKHQRKQD